MEKLEIGSWVLLPRGGYGKVVGFENGLVVVEVDYEYLVALPPEALQPHLTAA
ncbi:hypothetical protein [Desulfofundulus sp.]|uniref:hypothetical protein n=1 Tax=Desulfofundulus sp. TaxID=2282750 RepID=UPI003C742D16